MKHTILFLAANPGRTDRLALDQEARSIHVGLERSRGRDQFEFVTRWAAEPLDVIRELRKLRPTVVHFSGHGSPEGAAGRHEAAGWRDAVGAGGVDEAACPGLYFHGPDGSPRVVSVAALRDAFGAAGASVKRRQGYVMATEQETPLTEPAMVDMAKELGAIRALLQCLESEHAAKIGRALDDADEEVAKKTDANKDELGRALDRALGYAKSATAFATVATKLAPHVRAAVAWLGDTRTALLSHLP